MYVTEMVERLDTKSSVKLSGFRLQLEASCVSSLTEELWYNETVCPWMTIYIDIFKNYMNDRAATKRQPYIIQ